MQKLLKAMPDVRRDYVRELDTALVESRSSEMDTEKGPLKITERKH